jgi:hypothetical protein
VPHPHLPSQPWCADSLTDSPCPDAASSGWASWHKWKADFRLVSCRQHDRNGTQDRSRLHAAVVLPAEPQQLNHVQGTTNVTGARLQCQQLINWLRDRADWEGWRSLRYLAAGPLQLDGVIVLAIRRLYCSSVYSVVGFRMLVPTLFTATSARHKVKSAWQNGNVMHSLRCRCAGALSACCRSHKMCSFPPNACLTCMWVK